MPHASDELRVRVTPRALVWPEGASCYKQPLLADPQPAWSEWAALRSVEPNGEIDDLHPSHEDANVGVLERWLPSTEKRSLHELSLRPWIELEWEAGRFGSPDVYEALVPVFLRTDDEIIGPPQVIGEPEQRGDQPPDGYRFVGHAIRMRRLPETARLDARLARDEITPAHLRRIAEALFGLHRHGGRPRLDEVPAMAQAWRDALRAAHTGEASCCAAKVAQRLRQLVEESIEATRERWAARGATQTMIDGHGDARISKVFIDIDPAHDVLWLGREADRQARLGDPLLDVAMFAHDLAIFGRPDHAETWLRHYAALAGWHMDEEVEPLWRAAAAYRWTRRAARLTQLALTARAGASVWHDGLVADGGSRSADLQPGLAPFPSQSEARRAAASAFASQPTLATRGSDLATTTSPTLPRLRLPDVLRCADQAWLEARAAWLQALAALEFPAARSCLILIAGLPGTGKSTLARGLAEQAGFDVIETDAVRKELAGLAPTDRSGKGVLYSPQWHEKTYDECLRRTEVALVRGGRVAIAATFWQERRRWQFLALAWSLHVPALILCCRASADAVRQRIRQREERGGDVSDAGVDIFEEMLRKWEPATGSSERAWRALPTDDGPTATLEAAVRVLSTVGLA